MRWIGSWRRTRGPATGQERTSRVFLGPSEIAGYFARLGVGMQAIGVATMYVDLSGHSFSYSEAPRPTLAVRLVRSAQRHAGDEFWLSQGLWLVINIAARAALLLWAIIRCDVFIFGFGQSLLRLHELPLLRLLGKRLVFVFFGSDARPAYLDGIDANGPDVTAEQLVALTRAKRKMIRRLEEYADVIVSHGAYSQLLRREYADWMQIGIPTLPDHSTPPSSWPGVRVLHAPSDPLAKGTALIREMVARLQQEGLEIDYRELQGASNVLVQQLLAETDVVVDQPYADTPMAVLASEAAAAGKPTLVGSLDWSRITAGIEPAALPPTIRCAPESMGAALRDLVRSGEARQAAGQRARAFVRNRWSPEDVARRYLALADGRAPRAWFRSPQSIQYIGGSGLTRDKLRHILQMVGAFQGDAFSVADKPELTRRLAAADIGEWPSSRART